MKFLYHITRAGAAHARIYNREWKVHQNREGKIQKKYLSPLSNQAVPGVQIMGTVQREERREK